MAFEQGHFLDRPGEVRVRVGDAVRVGGRAVRALSGTLRIPESDDEGIVEA
jgi:predicted PhzF superfamily epimerase YddE/YHI9